MTAPAAATTNIWTYDSFSNNIVHSDDGDHVYVIESGELVSLDADTGEKEWETSGYTFDTIDAGGGIVVGADNQEDAVAIDADTQEELWRTDKIGNQLLSIGVDPDNNFVLASSTGNSFQGVAGELRGINLNDGTTVWSREGEWNYDVNGAGVGNGKAAVLSDETLHIIDQDTGNTEWTENNVGLNILAMQGNTVAVNDDAKISAYEVDSGNELFSESLNLGAARAVDFNDDGNVVAVNDDNDGNPVVREYDLSGNVVNEAVYEEPIYDVAVDGERLYFGGQTIKAYSTLLKNPSPKSGAIDSPAELSIELSAEVSSVEFRDASDDSVIERISDPSSGELTADWAFDATARPQRWYAAAVDSNGTVMVASEEQVFNSLHNASPSNENVFEPPVTLEIDVAGVADAYGGSATVTFYNGSDAQIGQDTLSADGTATATYNNAVAGTNEWYATVKGSNGQTDTLINDRLTFQAPEQLEIRDEQNPGTLITNPGSAEVRFYTDSDQVYTRSPDNGTIPLAGLPADETFVAAVSVEGYNTRTITIDSLLEQQTAYLLSENATVAEVDFELNDQTNQFPADQTTLFVQRAITRNNSTAWRTIVGERFGATGTVPTTLAAGDRYRLKVRNGDGDMRALGSYVAAGAAVEPLRIGQVTFQGAQDSGASFSSRFDSSSGSEAVDLRYVDPSGDTDELNVTVRRQDANNTVVFQDSISGPIDTYRERIPTSALPDHTDDSSYKVEYSAARSGAAVPISGNRTIGDVPSVATDWPIDPQFLNIAGYLFILALFGAMVILSPRHAGLVGSATAFALSIMGVIAINSLVLSFALVVSGLFAVGGES
jgi:hypothetical protein